MKSAATNTLPNQLLPENDLVAAAHYMLPVNLYLTDIVFHILIYKYIKTLLHLLAVACMPSTLT